MFPHLHMGQGSRLYVKRKDTAYLDLDTDQSEEEDC